MGRIKTEQMKPFSTEFPSQCEEIIRSFQKAGTISDFTQKLDTMKEWSSVIGKTEMGRWVAVLNDCDEILEAATTEDEAGVFQLDRDEAVDSENSVISILKFHALLFENSFSRSVYSSVDRLLKLLESSKMRVIVQTLRLLLVISKSSRFITQHLKQEDKDELSLKLTAIVECWTGKVRSVSISDFCDETFTLPQSDVHSITVRTSAGSKFFEAARNKTIYESKFALKRFLEDTSVVIEKSERILVQSKLRFLYSTSTLVERCNVVMSRLISTSVLFYSRCLLSDEWRVNCLSSEPFTKELCAILHISNAKYAANLDQVKTEALKTLGSIVFLEKPRKIQLIVDSLDLGSYHGYTPTLIRKCVEKLKACQLEISGDCSISFVTALFSLVYHIAGLDYGGDALVSSSMTTTLLNVIKAHALPENQISFVTRAVRIIDILTGIDVSEFHTNDGMKLVVDRFVHEINQCTEHIDSGGIICHQQRLALMKSLLNFLKRAVVDSNYANHVRRIIESELPTSIKFLVEHPQYFGPSQLQSAINLTTSFIYQEPAQLNVLQDKGLTDALLDSLLNEKFPASRDLVTGLPNLCSALCLNERGLSEFKKRKPLERIFRMIFSTKFLSSMRKRKTEILESATMLGMAFDELMRHQPTLRKDLMETFASVLDEILAFNVGQTSERKAVISWNIGKNNVDVEELEQSKSSESTSDSTASSVAGGGSVVTSPHTSFQMHFVKAGVAILPLGDYLGIIGGLLEAILTNRAAQENSQAMLDAGVLGRLTRLLTFAEQPSPSLLQSHYLVNLANIMRFVLALSGRVDDSFVAFVAELQRRLDAYARCSTQEEATHKDRLYAITQMSALIIVMNNFFKSSVSGPQDTRPQLLTFFATHDTGKAFVQSIFKAYQNLSLDLLLVMNTASDQQHTTTSADNDKSEQDSNPTGSAAIQEEAIPMETDGSSTVELQTQSTSTKREGSSERSVYSVATRCFKQLGELIVCMGKTLNSSSLTRLRHHLTESSAVTKNLNQFAESLFEGVARLLDFDGTGAEIWCGVSLSASTLNQMLCQIFSILKKLLFDDAQNHAQMLPHFYKSKCHAAFFAASERWLLPNASQEQFATSTLGWVSIVQRLVGLSSVLMNPKAKTAGLVGEFEPKKYLATCQKDVLRTLGALFKALNSDDYKSQEDYYKLLEKIIACFQVLLRGLVDLHELEKKTNANEQMEMEVLINEIDTDKVQQLVEMGFSQSEAVDALLQHSSVPEAAEFLVAQLDRDRARQLQTPVLVAAPPAPNLIPEVAAPAADGDIPLPTSNAATTPADEGAGNEQKPQTSSVIVSPFNELKSITTEDFRDSIDYVCNEIVPECLSLVQRNRMLVFGVSELLAVFSVDPLASSWVEDVFIKKLLEDIGSLLDLNLGLVNTEDEKSVNKLAALLHLFCLVWQHFPAMKIYARLTDDFYEKTCKLFTRFSAEKSSRKALSPLILFIDLFEKEKRMDSRRKLFDESVEHIQWFYWSSDERYGTTGGWKNYPPICSVALNNAFRDNKPFARITIAEKNFCVDFAEMVQKPVFELTQPPPTHSHMNIQVFAKAKLREGFAIERLFENEAELRKGHDRHAQLIRTILQLLENLNVHNEETVAETMDAAVPKDKEQLTPQELTYSSLSLLLHLTSLEGMTKVFVEENGISTLLRLECRDSSLMPSLMNTVIALTLRLCIDNEEALTLQDAFSQIVRATCSGLPTSTADSSSSRRPYTRISRYRKDWRHVIRHLNPLAIRNPVGFVEAMKQNVKIKGDEISLTEKPAVETEDAKAAPTPPKPPTRLQLDIVHKIVTELLSTDFSAKSNQFRVLQPVSLLKFLSELLRSYPPVAQVLIEMRHEGRPVLAWIIDRFLLQSPEAVVPAGNNSPGAETAMAAKAVLTNLVSEPTASQCAKANEAIVDEIRALLHTVVVDGSKPTATSTSVDPQTPPQQPPGTVLSEKVATLARLIILLRESVQSQTPGAMAAVARDHIKNAGSLVRVIHRKNLMVDFVKAIWSLPLHEKHTCETVNIVLRMFEGVARDMTSLVSVRNAALPSGQAPNAAGQDQPEALGAPEPAANEIEVRIEDRQHRQHRNHQNGGDLDQLEFVDQDSISSSSGDDHSSLSDESEMEEDAVNPHQHQRGAANANNTLDDTHMDDDEFQDDEADEDDAADRRVEMDAALDAAFDDTLSEDLDATQDADGDDLGRLVVERVEAGGRHPPVPVPVAVANLDEPHHDEDDDNMEDDDEEDDGDIDELDDGEGDEDVFADIMGEYFEGMNDMNEWAHDIRSISAEINRLNVHAQQAQLQNIIQFPGGPAVAARPPTGFFRSFIDLPGMAGARLHVRVGRAGGPGFPNGGGFIPAALMHQHPERAMQFFDRESVVSQLLAALNGISREANLDRRTIEGFVPYFLDRLQDQARLLDALSLHHLMLIITAFLAAELEVVEEKPKEEAITAEADASAEKPAEEADATAAPQNPDASASEPIAQEQPAAEVGGSEEVLVERMEIDESPTPAAVAMTTTDAAPPAAAEVPAVVVPEIGAGPSTPPIAEAPVEEQQQQDDPSTMEDFRAILGDIAIPEGVDPAFLAALPDDMRQEVIRDHMRQQRAVRIAQHQANPADAPAPLGIDVPEGMDPDFLAALPEDMAEEVVRDHQRQQVEQRRRQERIDEANALRQFHIGHGGHPRHMIRVRHRAGNGGAVGDNAALSGAPPALFAGGERGVQLFDKESIVTLLLLYFLDQEKLSIVRLQKLLKLVCLHSATCDYVVWCLTSMLDALNNAEDLLENDAEDDPNQKRGWLDGFRLQLALNQSEKVLKLAQGKVKIHPLVRTTVCQHVLDAFAFLARNFPHHFLPAKIRLPDSSAKKNDPVPDVKHFWEVARKVNDKSSGDGTSHHKSLAVLRNIVPATLEQSPFAFLLQYTGSKIVKESTALLDKNLRILQILAQAIPSNSESKVGEESAVWLTRNLTDFTNVLLDRCVDDGLRDGRAFLVEVLRAMPGQRPALSTTLANVIKDQGKQLLEHINQLLAEIAEAKAQKPTTAETDEQGAGPSTIVPPASTDSTASTTAAAEPQFATLRMLTGRDNQAKKLLKSLETVSYLRSQLKAAERRRKLPAAAASTSEEQESQCQAEAEEESNLRSMLEELGPLWTALSDCLEQMAAFADAQHTVLSLQHAAEAFFLAHSLCVPQPTTAVTSGEAAAADAPTTSAAGEQAAKAVDTSVTRTSIDAIMDASVDPQTKNMFAFAEKHRTVLNQILRGNVNSLMEDSAFAILTNYPKLLDFDVKRKYFYKEIRKLDDRRLRHEDIAVHVRRLHLFSDSFRELYRLSKDEWKSRFYIIFEGEEGQDAGGLLREWYSVITREIFNPNYALFITAPGDRVTYMINKSSYINPEHLDYFKFVGRVIAKAIYDNKQLDSYFTRAFYKHILNIHVRYQDIESEDPAFFKSLDFMLQNPIELIGSELTFSLEVEEFGVRSLRHLKEEGNKLTVTDENKEEYVHLVCQMKMTGSIRKQLDAFLEGFYEVIPKRLISIFNEQELELLISGMPEIDIDDLQANTEYKTYTRTSPQIVWFWRALRSFEKEDLAKFLQFVTGTSKVPLQGFSQLEGMNGVQRFTIHMDSRSTTRLPSAHTCFNQLDLPKYPDYESLRRALLLASRECSEGFAFA